MDDLDTIFARMIQLKRSEEEHHQGLDGDSEGCDIGRIERRKPMKVPVRLLGMVFQID
jgi:hypothetical protein